MNNFETAMNELNHIGGMTEFRLKQILELDGVNRETASVEEIVTHGKKYSGYTRNPDMGWFLDEEMVAVHHRVFVRQMCKLKSYLLRVSDNVLDEEDWPIFIVYIDDGKVRYQRQETTGAHPAPYMFGWPVEKIAEWLRHDDTGEYPEMYHDIYSGKHGKFTSIYELDGGLT